MYQAKSIAGLARPIVAMCLAALLLAVMPLSGAFAAQGAVGKPAAPKADETPAKIHELMTLLADPKVQAWLEKEAKAEAASQSAPESAEMSVSQMMDSQLGAIRTHILMLGAAIPDLPNQLERGSRLVTAELGDGGRVKGPVAPCLFRCPGFWRRMAVSQGDPARPRTARRPSYGDRARAAASDRPAIGLYRRRCAGLRYRQRRRLPCASIGRRYCARWCSATSPPSSPPEWRWSSAVSCLPPSAEALPHHSDGYDRRPLLVPQSGCVRRLVCIRLGHRRAWLALSAGRSKRASSSLMRFRPCSPGNRAGSRVAPAGRSGGCGAKHRYRSSIIVSAFGRGTPCCRSPSCCCGCSG